MLRRTLHRPDRLVIVESPNKTAKISSILQASVPDWTFGEKRLAMASNKFPSAKEGVAVMATVGHFMDTKDIVISRSDLVLPSTSSLSLSTSVGSTDTGNSPAANKAKGAKGSKKKGGKAGGGAASAALLDLPPLPKGAQLLSFTPDIKVRDDNTSMEAIIRYIQANKNLNEVVLASDPDREGELIAVHALRHLMKKAGLGKRSSGHPLLFSRAYIQSITEEGVLKAMRERKMQYCDFALAESASARHSMDRLFGWIGSTLMRKIDRSFVSIGRVQTPALILIRDREQKIQEVKDAHKASFIIQGKFNIFMGTGVDGGASTAEEVPVYAKQVNFSIEYSGADVSKKVVKEAKPTSDVGTADAASSSASSSGGSSHFATKEEAEKWLAEQFGGPSSPSAKSEKGANQPSKATTATTPKPLKMKIVKAPVLTAGKQKPPLPHTMQSLLTAASNQLKLSSEDVTKCLQELFQSGLVTYPRTDSTRIDEAFLDASLKTFIEKQYGQGSFANNQKKGAEASSEKGGEEGNHDNAAGSDASKGEKKKAAPKKKEKEANVEDAHEALRPTSLDRNPADPSVMALFGIGNATPISITDKKASSSGGADGGANPYFQQRNNLANLRSAYPVYKMIYQQTLAAFMAPAETETTTVTVGVRPDSEGSGKESDDTAASAPMLVAKLTATRLVKPGWRSAKLGRDAAAVAEAMLKGKGVLNTSSAEGVSESEGGADEDGDDLSTSTTSSNTAISTFDLINNLPKYIAADSKEEGSDQTTAKGKTEENAPNKDSSSVAAFYASVGDLKVAEKTVVLPKPFTEGSLIQTLKDHGVGRPSTYPSILKTLFDRKYIVRDGSQRLHTTPTGQGVVRAARNAFPTLVDIGFTTSFERELNAISNYRAHSEKEDAPAAEEGKSKSKKEGEKGVILLSDPSNPDLGEGANPLTCYTLSRLTYSLAGMVDGAIVKHLLLQEYKLSDMRSIVTKTRSLASEQSQNTNNTNANTTAPVASSATSTSPVQAQQSAAVKAYANVSLFDRDPTFESRRNQIAWRLPKIDIPLLLDTVEKGQFKVSPSPSTSGYNKGAAGGPEVLKEMTLNTFTGKYLDKHLGLAIGFGGQLHMLGIDKEKTTVFNCPADEERLLAIPLKPSVASAVVSSVSVPTITSSPSSSSSASTAAGRGTAATPQPKQLAEEPATTGKKKGKKRKNDAGGESLPLQRTPTVSTSSKTSEGERNTQKTTASSFASSPSVAASSKPAPTTEASDPKKAFDPMEFFRMGGVRR